MTIDRGANGRLPVALVTGGGRGIGRAISQQLARDGYAVAINYLSDAESANQLASALRREGLVAEPVQGDVCDPAAVSQLISTVVDRLGEHPTVLVNNVGEFSLGPVRDTSLEHWRRLIDSNLNSAFYVTHEVLPEMRRRRHGRIVFIGMGPTLQLRGAPNIAAYAIAKTGIAILTRSLAVEEADQGITVNCVAPGLIDNGYLSPEEARWMKSRVPSGRLGEPAEVADAVQFLISQKARYVSGATLSVSGGWEWDNRPLQNDSLVEDMFKEDVAHV